MRRTPFVTLCTLMIVGWAVGCGSDQTAGTTSNSANDSAQQSPEIRQGEQTTEPSGVQPSHKPAASADKTARGPSKEAVDVRVLDWDGIQKLVAEQKGKVVVVDVWSTWCQPCVREFPNLVALHKKYPEKVACISVNTNYDGIADEPTEEQRQEVRQFLIQQGATFTNVICSVPDLDLYEKLGIAGPPVIYVYNSHGKLQQQFDNEDPKREEFTYQKDVIPLLEKLLAEGT